MRVQHFIKETYERVGDNEYNQINPYVRAIGQIKHKYPNAEIASVKTVWEELSPESPLIFPILEVRFEVGE